MFAGHTALQAASQNGHIEVIKVLIKHSVNMEVEVGVAWLSAMVGSFTNASHTACFSWGFFCVFVFVLFLFFVFPNAWVGDCHNFTEFS